MKMKIAIIAFLIVGGVLELTYTRDYAGAAMWLVGWLLVAVMEIVHSANDPRKN